MTKKKAVAKKKNGKVVSLDAFDFEQDANDGVAVATVEELALPFLKLIQGVDSDTLKLLKAIEGNEAVEAGFIYNNVTLDVYNGYDGLKVIPCAYQRRYLQWAPRSEGLKHPVNIFLPHEARPPTERNKETNYDMMVDGPQGHYIQETHNHYVIVVLENGTTQPGIVSMKQTGLKKSRKWNSMVQTRNMVGKNGPFTPPRYSHVYNLRSVQEKNAKGEFANWEVTVHGLVEHKAHYIQAKTFADSANKGEVTVKYEAEGATEGETSAKGETSGPIPF